MYTYYQLIKNSKDPVPHRAAMVKYAIEHGNKPAARKFQTSVKTVRKWRIRFENGKRPALKDKSRRPVHSPNSILPFWYFKILDICKKAQKRKKRINAVLIKRKYNIPYSTKTILKVMRESGYMPQKRRKYQRKRDLREIKKQLKPFEKIQVDIKYLDDIPEFYTAYRVFRLPKYQITARCVRTGALFYTYAIEKTSTNTTMFLLRLGEHLQAHGVDLKTVAIQTDNGTEFASTWNSLKDCVFTKAIEQIWKSEHKTIPPGAKTWQSDVETSHRLIEDEFYAFEEFPTRFQFFRKAATYQRWFNLQRNNSYKQGTPLGIMQQAQVNYDPGIMILKPILIDSIYRKYKDTFRSLAA